MFGTYCKLTQALCAGDIDQEAFDALADWLHFVSRLPIAKGR